MPSLEFKGKSLVYAHHLTVPHRPLVVDPVRSVGEAGANGNLIIHGDNLEALKALLPRYAGRVKCIYIDPPYNTGNEGWTYNDNVNSPLLQEWFKENSPVDGEDLERHDKWLCMMWPRLHLLRELLSEDGVIFVSIDDNEQHHLRMLMDEIFGEENFLSSIMWHKSYSPQMDAAGFSVSHDYIMSYRRSGLAIVNREPFEQNIEQFRFTEAATGRPYRRRSLRKEGSNSLRVDAPRSWFPLTGPDGTQVFPYKPLRAGESERIEGVWRWSHETYSKRLDNGEVEWVLTDNDGWQPYAKQYVNEGADRPPGTVWTYDEVGHTHDAAEEVAQLLGPRAFQTPKPVALLKRLIGIATRADDDPIVLDSFAGSGTTAHAVLALNREDGGSRKFILVECEDYADSVTAERVRRVIAGVPEAKDEALRDGLGGSFAYCTLGDALTIEGLLTGDGMPSFAALAAWLLHTAAGVTAATSALSPLDDDGLFYDDGVSRFHLLYEPDIDFLRGEDAVLTETRARRIGEDGRRNGRKAVVFAAAKYLGQRELSEYGVTFSQLPYELHRRG